MSQDTELSPKRSSNSNVDVKKGRASSSSIAQLVQQEELNQIQMDMSDDERSQISGDDSDDHSHEPRKNTIEEVDDNEEDCQLDAGNPYASSNEMGGKGNIVPDKNLPYDRWGHTMTLIDEDRLLVYGGQTFDKNENKIMTLADLHVYDMSKHVWSRPINCEGMPRCWVSRMQMLSNISLFMIKSHANTKSLNRCLSNNS
jgi:hypothetical protein